MRCYVRWIFVVLVMCSLTSFMGKGKHNRGLSVGDVAPDFRIQTTSGEEQTSIDLANLKGRYVLLSFWASYDAPSRMQNASLNNLLCSSDLKVELVSVSFDEYQSVFVETVRKDQINAFACFMEQDGEDSETFKDYGLNGGFANYLLDENGVIVAKNITAKDISTELWAILKTDDGGDLYAHLDVSH